MKQNCWEIKKCGREIGGLMSSELGVCPAASTEKLDNSNGGKNGGRSCWVVAGTFCGGKAQGIFAQNLQSCMICVVYITIKSEELATGNYLSSTELLKKVIGIGVFTAMLIN
jgi:hypothetical protein